jgi:hypothetical protein
VDDFAHDDPPPIEKVGLGDRADTAASMTMTMSIGQGSVALLAE